VVETRNKGNISPPASFELQRCCVGVTMGSGGAGSPIHFPSNVETLVI
jgi:hypothetical protein